MKPEIVVLKALYEPALAALERGFIVHKSYAATDALAFIRQHCGNTRAAISTTTTQVTRAHFTALPKLELLACYGPYPYFDNLESMAREVDCLIVTCALTPATRNHVDARILAALGTDGFLDLILLIFL